MPEFHPGKEIRGERASKERYNISSMLYQTWPEIESY